MRKKTILFFIINFLFILFSGIYAQTVSLDTNRMRIGEYNALNFSLDASKCNVHKIVWPSLNDILTEHKFEIIEIGNQDTIFDDKNEILAFNQKIVFSVFDSGWYVIPSIGIAEVGADSTDFVAYTDSLMLEVLTVPVDTTLAFKDIKGPMEEPIRFSEILPYILMVLLFLAIIGLAYYFYNRYKKQKPLFRMMERETLKPHDWAFSELTKIKNRKLWQQGRVKDFYVEMTDVLRRYFQEEFQFSAMEMTSSEIYTKLRNLNFDKEIIESVSIVLSNADLAKFAKSTPLDIDNEKCMELSFSIIQNSHDFMLKIQEINKQKNEKGGATE